MPTTFHLVGSEILDGRDTWVIAGEPRPGFQAHLKEAQMLSKFRGRLWIDKNDLQLAKMDVEADRYGFVRLGSGAHPQGHATGV